ncbi:MAG: DNA polymerase IV [Bacilli bacterium]|nr:DNA polymerase IV [Bacilli bacterium]
MKDRIIFHLDVNNAFLSWSAVDLLEHGYKKDIRKIPAIIGGDETRRRGIVLAKSPVAKKYGIKTADTIYEAKKKCPQIELYPPYYELYSKKSRELFTYLKKYTPTIEQFSVDEAFLDMSGTNLLYKDHVKLAHTIKDDIKKRFGYTVNIGVANNKLCAKMASDFEKPDKVHTLFNDEIKEKMWPLPVEDLFMCGKKSAERLHSLGIDTIGDLAKADVGKLYKHFKNQANFLIESAKGIDNSKVIPRKERTIKNESISTSRTLSYDYTDIDKLKEILFKQAERLGRELRQKKKYTTTVGIVLKNNLFKSYSHQRKVEATNKNSVIYKTACELLERNWREDPIRLIGIRLADLTTNRDVQLSFDSKEENKEEEIIQDVMDRINNKFGGSSVIPASMKKKKD